MLVIWHIYENEIHFYIQLNSIRSISIFVFGFDNYFHLWFESYSHMDSEM